MTTGVHRRVEFPEVVFQNITTTIYFPNQRVIFQYNNVTLQGRHAIWNEHIHIFTT